MKNGAPSIWSPATPPRFQSSAAPSAALYQATAAAASGTINITERSGPPVSSVITQQHVTAALAIAQHHARLLSKPTAARRQRRPWKVRMRAPAALCQVIDVGWVI